MQFMPSPKLLWIANQAETSVEKGWSALLGGFCVVPVTNLGEARSAIAHETIACALITGDLPDCDPVEALEVIHSHDANLPVVFWEPEMRAADAVRLIRAGADHCFGSGDCLEALRNHLEIRLEDRDQQERSCER